jgi:hypothetical protein
MVEDPNKVLAACSAAKAARGPLSAPFRERAPAGPSTAWPMALLSFARLRARRLLPLDASRLHARPPPPSLRAVPASAPTPAARRAAPRPRHPCARAPPPVPRPPLAAQRPQPRRAPRTAAVGAGLGDPLSDRLKDYDGKYGSGESSPIPEVRRAPGGAGRRSCQGVRQAVCVRGPGAAPRAVASGTAASGSARP